MHILCPICSDLVNQAENIYVTKCGHVFHFQCLSQWIERSKSCPQCRNKVTERCMFRLYPTVSSEPAGEDVATLQSRLDDVLLKMRQHRATCKEHEDKAAVTEAELAKHVGMLKTLEKRLETRETAISAMKEQLEYLKIHKKETEKLKEENENLKKNIGTLNGLQKVLNATSEDVERMLEGYSDVRTVATFATALKRALCEAENKKNESRDRLQAANQKLSAEKSIVADLQTKLAFANDKLTMIYRKYKSLQQKRKSDVLGSSFSEEIPSSAKKMRPDLNAAMQLSDSCSNSFARLSDQHVSKSEAPDSFLESPATKTGPDLNAGMRLTDSFNSMVNNIENADSPYLRLQQSSLALALTRPSRPAHPLPDTNLKPSEYKILVSATNAVARKPESKTSIFQKKEPIKMNFSQENDPNLSLLNISYDGLGGHSKLDTFPVAKPKHNFKSCIPKLSAKHKLKRPTPVGTQDIGKMLEKASQRQVD